MYYEPRHRATGRSARRLRRSILSTTLATMAITTATGTSAAFGSAGANTRAASPLGPIVPVSARPSVPTSDDPVTWEDPVVVTSTRANTDVSGFGRRGRADQIDAIPGPALLAYQRAEAIMGEAAARCRLDWTLLAAVGRVLTDHGQRRAHRVDDEGEVRPGIVGKPLLARGGKRISDTDAGLLDEDRRFDRAVGPMLLAPVDWSVVGVDGDGDGRRNPQDLDDATLALAVLLCARGDDLRTTEGKRTALRRIDDTRGFVRAVLAVERDYRKQLRSGVDPVAIEPLTTVPALPTPPLVEPEDRTPKSDRNPKSDPSADSGVGPGPHPDKDIRSPHEPDRGDGPRPPEPKDEPKPEPKPEPETEPATEPTEPATEPTEPPTEPTEPPTEPTEPTEPEDEPEPEPKDEPEPEPKDEPKNEPKPEPKDETEDKSDPEVETDSEVETEPTTEAAD